MCKIGVGTTTSVTIFTQKRKAFESKKDNGCRHRAAVMVTQVLPVSVRTTSLTLLIDQPRLHSIKNREQSSVRHTAVYWFIETFRLNQTTCVILLIRFSLQTSYQNKNSGNLGEVITGMVPSSFENSRVLIYSDDHLSNWKCAHGVSHLR